MNTVVTFVASLLHLGMGIVLGTTLGKMSPEGYDGVFTLLGFVVGLTFIMVCTILDKVRLIERELKKRKEDVKNNYS